MEKVGNGRKTSLEYLPTFKPKKKGQMECPHRVLVICDQMKPFYLCLNVFCLDFFPYMDAKFEKLFKNKDELKKIFCRCDRNDEGTIIPLSFFSEFEPCEYRCKELIETGKCPYIIQERIFASKTSVHFECKRLDDYFEERT